LAGGGLNLKATEKNGNTQGKPPTVMAAEVEVKPEVGSKHNLPAR
jgi:hypothetical protein